MMFASSTVWGVGAAIGGLRLFRVAFQISRDVITISWILCIWSCDNDTGANERPASRHAMILLEGDVNAAVVGTQNKQISISIVSVS